ncbi:hypothetical protein C8R44DRAFT_763469 [Mycena epipterygia]|nr:hypothetical protein C8R44DRAFT_763469 [Mycena epipterygia]
MTTTVFTESASFSTGGSIPVRPTPLSVAAPAETTVFASVVIVTATNSPQPSSSGSSSPGPPPAGQSNGISVGAIAGLSLGIGLLVGLVAFTLFFFYRGRRARNNAPSKDHESLLGYHNEKYPRLHSPVPQPAPMPNARVMEWIQRTRRASISTISSAFFLPMAKSETTVSRAQSIVSSRSSYSQASAIPTEENHVEGGGHSRPPELYRINE